MPLFRRPDGELVHGLPRSRLIMPFLMRRRNESAIYHKSTYDLTRTLPWLERFAATHATKATVFHLFLYACARALHEREALNRFVSGGRIYQHRDVTIAFVAKERFEDGAPFVTVKLGFPRDERFSDHVTRVLESIRVRRSGRPIAVDRELRVAFAAPRLVLRTALGVMNRLDALNLLPEAMIANDPLHASLFVANLGSVGIGDTFHHLYEHGTVGLFGAMGRVEKKIAVSDNGQPIARDGVDVCWTFDERVNDGFYCASALTVARAFLEDPSAHLGDAESA